VAATDASAVPSTHRPGPHARRPATHEYVIKRRGEGRTTKEIMRSLKPYVGRQRTVGSTLVVRWYTMTSEHRITMQRQL